MTTDGARDQGAGVDVERIQSEWVSRLPGITAPVSPGDEMCGVSFWVRQCANEVEVFIDDGWQPHVLRALGESLIAATPEDHDDHQ